jgi:hypothetical protein
MPIDTGSIYSRFSTYDAFIEWRKSGQLTSLEKESARQVYKLCKNEDDYRKKIERQERIKTLKPAPTVATPQLCTSSSLDNPSFSRCMRDLFLSNDPFEVSQFAKDRHHIMWRRWILQDEDDLPDSFMKVATDLEHRGMVDRPTTKRHHDDDEDPYCVECCDCTGCESLSCQEHCEACVKDDCAVHLWFDNMIKDLLPSTQERVHKSEIAELNKKLKLRNDKIDGQDKTIAALRAQLASLRKQVKPEMVDLTEPTEDKAPPPVVMEVAQTEVVKDVVKAPPPTRKRVAPSNHTSSSKKPRVQSDNDMDGSDGDGSDTSDREDSDNDKVNNDNDNKHFRSCGKC